MSAQQTIDSILEKITPYQLETIKLTPKRKTLEFIWSSKFGGQPYWPVSQPYPQQLNGKPLLLLAQLNFEEMPALKGYPNKGILQFFIANNDHYGLDFDKPVEELINKPDGYRVVYHPEISNDVSCLQTGLPEIGSQDYLPLSGEYALEFTLIHELPALTDYRFGEIAGDFLEDEVEDYLWEHLDAGGSKVGGYANFTQDDPRGIEDNGDWVLLFQMDTEYSDDIDIMWGDSGVANFFIEPEALARCDFSRVWYNWDCY
ncbi:YwqG family protein [Endozoicomonas sp. Mp262]|uniref:YwqG family protein n=1 Tax=Endozoicomonas sp. Mp262 TaxID=2919499 RepID=UPI0021DA3FC7